ncbi:stage V sporulation protein AD [Pueribacillus theae]|uniref:Stage V sporulation protein AD n=1 Tax=Pueribacillus theae TaxID=2171751 RepID=A0A2U1K6V2_9BACI|nr:stage V sporulation protein AD [Pueribacillus theae]PWA13256.1 stage V sporulation protein AD [Pueribacillus theae]
MLQGHRTWKFENKPVIKSSATVGGPFEARGKIADDFDVLHEDLWMGQDSYEKAENVLLEEAFLRTTEKAGITKDKVQFMLAGNLINQLTPVNFAARTIGAPYLGLFGACSTSMEGLALSALIVNSGAGNHVLTGAVSHNASAERQFRYPTEYGAQKPPTAQWTVTGAGAALITSEGEGPCITSATIGKVVDMGLSDPLNMGGAMAPAAVDTIEAHLKDTGMDINEYDFIVTGDLGKIGRDVSLDLFHKHHIDIDESKYLDCGLMIYEKDQQVFAGGSGTGCSAVVVYGHLLNRMKKGEFNKILAVATGALLSPLSYQQKETIPCIAHAVAIEYGGGLS